MSHLLKRTGSILAMCTSCIALSGCLITGLSSNRVGDLTTATATVQLLDGPPCIVDAGAVTTTCMPVMQIGQPPAGQVFQFNIVLLNYAAPLAFYDPLIVQVPATMSDFAGSIAVGPPGVTPGTPLAIQAGLTSIPIDADTNLVAEPGMQLVIIDFVGPNNAPFGQYTLNFQFRGSANSIKVIFAGKVTVGSGALAKTYYPPIFPCVTSMSEVTPINLPVANLLALLNIVVNAQGCAGKQYNLTAPTTPPGGNVVEFYNAALDHYFITHIPAEIANLDAGLTPTKWNRTGLSFNMDTATQTGTSPVCRYYIPPELGDSHFFGRGTTECNATGQNNPTFVLEAASYMFTTLPVLGVCPGGTIPIYRVFSNRPDANHRYMTDRAVRDQMVAIGWVAEGDGDDLVVMCGKP